MANKRGVGTAQAQPMTKDPQQLLGRARAQAAGQPRRTPPIMDPAQKPGRDPAAGGVRVMPGGPGASEPISLPGPPGGAPQVMDGAPGTFVPPGQPGGPNVFHGTSPMAGGVASMDGVQQGQANPGGAMFNHPGQQLGVAGPGQGPDQQMGGAPPGGPAWQQLQAMGMQPQGSAAANRAALAQAQGADPMMAISQALQARQAQGGGAPGGPPPSPMPQMGAAPGQMPVGPQNLSQIYAKPLPVGPGQMPVRQGGGSMRQLPGRPGAPRSGMGGLAG